MLWLPKLRNFCKKIVTIGIISKGTTHELRQQGARIELKKSIHLMKIFQIRRNCEQARARKNHNYRPTIKKITFKLRGWPSGQWKSPFLSFRFLSFPFFDFDTQLDIGLRLYLYLSTKVAAVVWYRYLSRYIRKNARESLCASGSPRRTGPAPVTLQNYIYVTVPPPTRNSSNPHTLTTLL